MTPAESIVHLSFNVPFSSNLSGPDPDEILHASPEALQRWTFPEGTDPATPMHKLPAHQNNVDVLRRLCQAVTDGSGGRVEAVVTSADLKGSAALQGRPLKGLVTNVCVSGDAETVHQMRARILNETPIAVRCAYVDIDTNLVIDQSQKGVKANILEHLDILSKFTGTDIFLLNPKPMNSEAVSTSYGSGTEGKFDQRLRIAIYGDPESTEHAKVRVLIMIDQVLRRIVDVVKAELPLQNIICGRTRKNIRLIEAMSKTAIYFPPSFPRIYGYLPPGAHRRGEDEIYITGDTQESILLAKKRLLEIVLTTKCYHKSINVSAHKIDSIILDRIDKVRKVMEANGTYVLFPPLASQRGLIRVQGTEILHVERTVREIMTLAGQFYGASWWLMLPDNAQGGPMRVPGPENIRKMLSDI
ncbi:MAG: hypothetical protein Q9183_005850, partial [Haloplaca sp. 2 TL-2023]